MGTRAPSRAAIATAVLFALSCFGFTLFVWKSFGGPTPLGARGYSFHILFPQATNLSENADVRISGVPVGKVIKVTPRGENTDAFVTLKRAYAPIPSDARAILRFKTLLGETFIELTPGSPRARKLRENESLPTRQIEPVQQIDQVLSAFDAPTRNSLKRLVVDFSAALNGRGVDINAALGNTAPAVDDLNQVAGILDSQRGALQGVIRDAGTALRAVGRRRAALQTLITSGDQVFSATAARNRELTATVRALPPLLGELRGTLGDARTTADALAPTLHRLRPVARLVRPDLAQASKLAVQLRPLFNELRPVIGAARGGLPAATDVVKAARPLIDVLDPAGRQLVPVVELLGRYKREIVTQLANLGAATQASITQPDGSALHYLRVLIPILNEGLSGFPQRVASNRHNPYFAPNALDDYANGGLRAFDCANTSSTQIGPVLGPGGAPPCVVAPPWNFRGLTRSFPHLEAYQP
ncbi:MAG TPA: MlaD family protein [Solirubrobacteraceae bacterium]|nr:MlaD family protein [Solirubrobacteraceae bacterium]